MESDMYRDVLKFWFEDIQPEMWWSAEPEFDELLRRRFLPLLEQAARGELFEWRKEPKGRLAEIIVLDQFSRNIYRHTPAAFAQDPVALVLAQEAVSLNALAPLSSEERNFMLSPYMHSESRSIHAVAESLYREFATPEALRFELRHKAIVDRFGRYPHRNRILGRPSSEEEIAFLKQPGSSF
jgi:uncharacterized protein (DUF924 family)